jgi:hypothetical protein
MELINKEEKHEKRLLKMREYYSQNKEKIIKNIRKKQNERYTREKVISDLNDGLKSFIRESTAIKFNIHYDIENKIYY